MRVTDETAGVYWKSDAQNSGSLWHTVLLYERFSCCTNISDFIHYISPMGQLLQAGVSSCCGTNSVWGLQPETSVVISVKLNFYYLVIKAAAMAKPDGFLLTLQLLLFYGVGENWTKGSCALYKIKAIIPTFLRHGGHRRGRRWVQSSSEGVYEHMSAFCVGLCIDFSMCTVYLPLLGHIPVQWRWIACSSLR